jgi:hypothetical protein
MEAKDYTNIAGTPFQQFVKDQIELRVEVVSKENRSPSDLLWLNNRNSWIRISSGTDVDDNNNIFPNEKGNILSKKYLLQAGLTDHTGGATSYKLRSGINGPNKAYSIGGTEFGFKPMPGLENLSVKTGGKLGTLREATIEFTCYNIEQLNIMDALYMKLGFSILIEWGHIPYLDNKTKKLETNPFPLEFYGIKTKEELMEKIQKNRVRHSGNYDAMWGTVKNFSYSFEGNGEFKCKVDLVGAGDILESLKINQSGTAGTPASEDEKKAKAEKIDSPYPVIANQNLSFLNEVLFKIFIKDVTLSLEEKINPFSFSEINWDYSNEYFKMINPYFKKLNIYLESMDSYNANTDYLAKYGYQYSLINKSNTAQGNGGNDVNIPVILHPKRFYSKTTLSYQVDGEDVDTDVTAKGLPQAYITLGHLLVLIMATGGIYDKEDNKPDAKSKPYIYIDVNPETNRCYTFPGHCSLDPTICMIASEKLPFNIDSSMLDKLRTMYGFYDEATKDYGGKFMWTLVNINFITSTLAKYQKADSKGDVMFVDFVKDILDGISKACGGFNEFRIVPDDDTRCVRIFDDKRNTKPLAAGAASPYTIIPVLGKKSLAYNFNYTSKIAPNMAAQITIAAQAQPEGVGQEALSFSHLTKGLTNRLAPARSTSTSDENKAAVQEDIQSAEERYIELRDFIGKIYNASNTGDLAPSEEKANEEAEREIERLNRYSRF